MNAPRQLASWRFLLSRRWLGYGALLFVFSLVCVWLGNWQFDRRAEARAEIARIDAHYDAPALPLAQAMPDPTVFDEDTRKWQPVQVRGHYINDSFLARNRPGAGGVGSHLIHAFRCDDGAIFFVDRGWVAISGATAATNHALQREIPAPPAGNTTLVARLRASEPGISGRSSAGRTIASINLPELAQLPEFADAERVYTAAYGLLVSEQPSAATGVLAERPIRDEGPHLSYALQWYVFIVIAGTGLVYGARQEHRTMAQATATASEHERRRSKHTRGHGHSKKLSDADEEDALLDG